MDGQKSGNDEANYKLFKSVHNAQSVASSVVVFLLKCPIALLPRSDFVSLLHFRLQDFIEICI